MIHDSRITHCSQGPHKLLFILALSQHLHRHCITQTWIYMKHLWFSFPFFGIHTSYAFNNNLFITNVYIPNRICILCEFTIIEDFSHTLLILSLKVSGRVTREDIKIILHWNMPIVLWGNEGLKRKGLRAKLRQLWFPSCCKFNALDPISKAFCSRDSGLCQSFFKHICS